MRNQTNIIFIAALAALIFFIDWYVFQGITTLTAGWESWQQVIQTAYWIFFGGLTVSFVYGLSNGRRKGKFTPFARLVFHTFLVVFITQLVFLLVLFAEDIYRGSLAAIHGFLPERTRFVSQVGLLLAGIPFVSFIYGMTRGKHDYKVHRHTLYFDDLPEAFDGFTITQISDIHAGSFRNAAAVQRGIDLINAQNSDLFVFTGDLVNNEAKEIEPWQDHFGQIKAPYGKFAILGNHDYGDYISWRSWQEKAHNLHTLKLHHASIGHRLLLDEHVTIEREGQSITLLGVENWGHGFGQRGDLEKALLGVDKNTFKILLSHDPSHWDAQVKDHTSDIHLTLSGHTHGMQFGIELPGLRWSPVKYRYPNWAGMTSHCGRYLYVNRGFGFLGFEGRVGIWPEITVIELKRKKS